MTDRLTGILTTTNPLTRELRNHLMPLLTGMAPVQHQMATQDAEIDINYRHSAIVAEHNHGRFGHRRFASGPRAGDRAPDAGPLLRTGGGAGESVRLFDLLRGTSHTLLLFGGPEPTAKDWAGLVATTADVRRQWGDLVRSFLIVDEGTWIDERDAAGVGEGSLVVDTDGALHHRYAAEMPCAYLIRPDGYVGFRSRPADPTALSSYLAGLLIAPS